jgi:hypothetical protein
MESLQNGPTVKVYVDPLGHYNQRSDVLQMLSASQHASQQVQESHIDL